MLRIRIIIIFYLPYIINQFEYSYTCSIIYSVSILFSIDANAAQESSATAISNIYLQLKTADLLIYLLLLFFLFCLWRKKVFVFLSLLIAPKRGKQRTPHIIIVTKIIIIITRREREHNQILNENNNCLMKSRGKHIAFFFPLSLYYALFDFIYFTSW